MTASRKTIAVVVRTERTSRIHEALRAAVGLGLRGAHVTVLASVTLRDHNDPHIRKALATLRELGQSVADLDQAARVVASCHAIEVWT